MNGRKMPDCTEEPCLLLLHVCAVVERLCRRFYGLLHLNIIMQHVTNDGPPRIIEICTTSFLHLREGGSFWKMEPDSKTTDTSFPLRGGWEEREECSEGKE